MKIFVLYLLLSLAVRAEDCSLIDKRAFFGSVYNQQDIGWCYAYVASDLISFSRRAELSGTKLSPFHIALLQNMSFSNHLNGSGGYVAEAIKLATYPSHGLFDSVNKGVCFSNLDNKIFSGKSDQTIFQQLSAILKLKDLFDSAVAKNDFLEFEKYYISLGLENSFIANLTPQQLFEVLRVKDRKVLGFALISQICPTAERYHSEQVSSVINLSIGQESFKPQKKGPTLVRKIKNGMDVINLIHEELNQDNIPALVYYADFIKSGSGSAKSRNDYHVSTIVGREKVGESCHLIVRNSWGGCLNANGKNKYSSQVTKCEHGYLWISEKNLSPNADGISFIPKKR